MHPTDRQRMDADLCGLLEKHLEVIHQAEGDDEKVLRDLKEEDLHDQVYAPASLLTSCLLVYPFIPST